MRQLPTWITAPFWIAAALFVPLFLVLTIATKREALKEVDRLSTELGERAELATGGAEATVPTFSVQPEWRFPIADSDYRVLTSPSGRRVSPLLNIEVNHEGLDVVAVWRAQVVAIEDGVVVEHWPPPDDYWKGHPTYGGMITIEHGGGIRTLYAHLFWTRVHTGDFVRAGEVIGRIGNTGKSDGPHLHFEVIDPSGERLNPLLYVRNPMGGLQ